MSSLLEMQRSGSLEKKLPKEHRYQCQQHTRDKISYQGQQKEPGRLVHSNNEEANEESKLDNDMPTFKIVLAGNPNSCIIKINKSFILY